MAELQHCLNRPRIVADGVHHAQPRHAPGKERRQTQSYSTTDIVRHNTGAFDLEFFHPIVDNLRLHRNGAVEAIVFVGVAKAG